MKRLDLSYYHWNSFYPFYVEPGWYSYSEHGTLLDRRVQTLFPSADFYKLREKFQSISSKNFTVFFDVRS